jgi:hypothetical protein
MNAIEFLKDHATQEFIKDKPTVSHEILTIAEDYEHIQLECAELRMELGGALIHNSVADAQYKEAFAAWDAERDELKRQVIEYNRSCIEWATLSEIQQNSINNLDKQLTTANETIKTLTELAKRLAEALRKCRPHFDSGKNEKFEPLEQSLTAYTQFKDGQKKQPLLPTDKR